jgi:hypothetical protein
MRILHGVGRTSAAPAKAGASTHQVGRPPGVRKLTCSLSFLQTVRVGRRGDVWRWRRGKKDDADACSTTWTSTASWLLFHQRLLPRRCPGVAAPLGSNGRMRGVVGSFPQMQASMCRPGHKNGLILCIREGNRSSHTSQRDGRRYTVVCKHETLLDGRRNALPSDYYIAQLYCLQETESDGSAQISLLLRLACDDLSGSMWPGA